jgi:hypothetical protein
MRTTIIILFCILMIGLVEAISITDTLKNVVTFDQPANMSYYDLISGTNASNELKVAHYNGANCIWGGCAWFNGTNTDGGYVKFNYSKSAGGVGNNFSTTGNWTVSFWIRFSSTTGSNSVWTFGKSATPTTNRWKFNNDGVMWEIYDGQTGVDYNLWAKGIKIRTLWNNVVERGYANGSIETWLNGTMVNQTRIHPTQFGSWNELWFGTQYPEGFAAASNMRGAFDEWYFWNRTLNTSEIAQLWNNGNGSFYPNFNTTPLVSSTCTCPGAAANWNVTMTDMCNITTYCNISTGSLTFYGTSGYFNISARITAQRIYSFPSNTEVKIQPTGYIDAVILS